MSTSTWLAIAAMIISAASAAVAGWQARNARMQADSAKRQAQVAEQRLIDDREERAENRRGVEREAVQQVVEHALHLINSAETAYMNYLRNGPRPELNGELTRHHTRLSIATHSVAMVYGKNATSDAVKKVELTAATLYPQ